jgi:hypothetical protein
MPPVAETGMNPLTVGPVALKRTVSPLDCLSEKSPGKPHWLQGGRIGCACAGGETVRNPAFDARLSVMWWPDPLRYRDVQLLGLLYELRRGIRRVDVHNQLACAGRRPSPLHRDVRCRLRLKLSDGAMHR